MFRMLMAGLTLLLTALPAFAQTATPVALEVDINPILVSVNNWLENSALAVPIVIAFAFAILGYVGQKIGDAFMRR